MACLPSICAVCGPTQAVWVSSHEQCVKCGRVLVSCCDGGAGEAVSGLRAGASHAEEAVKPTPATKPSAACPGSDPNV